MISSFARVATDDDDVRLQKAAIFIAASSCCIAGVIWTAMYWMAFGWGVVTALPLTFVAVVGTALGISQLTKNHLYAVYAQLLCIMYVPAGLQWLIGGLFDSGLVLLWSFLAPLGALFFFSMRQALVWFGLYLLNAVVAVVFDETLAAHRLPVSDELRQIFFLMNLAFASLVVFMFAGYFVRTANKERQRANALLLNVLPKEIATVLKTGKETIADHYASASVLFADIVGSTPLFAGMKPDEVVDWLNEVFTMFDRLVEKHGVEKIRTIGDNYMVAAGVPVTREDHAEVICKLALDMIEGLRQLEPRQGRRIQFRLGINSGPLVAGVIGKSKFQYDLWGDTVNMASRMESHGEVGRVHVSQATYELVKDRFACTSRGVLPIKGKGEMATWFVDHPEAAG